MKNYTTQQIRNVVLLGGTRSGKTTLAEAMLFEGKVIDRRGTEKKNAWLRERIAFWRDKGKVVGLLGGDHSTPLAYHQYLN